MRRFLALVALLYLSLIVYPASCDVKSVEVSPLQPIQGDVLAVTVRADTGEQVNVQVKFKKDLPVTGGSYFLELSGVDIPQRPNSFTVKASNVKNLVVAVKLGVWISMSKDAVNGVATLSSSGVFEGRYDTQIKGDAAVGASKVTIEVTAQTTVTMDGEGYYRVTYDSSSIPAGAFSVNVGGVSKIVILLEAGTVVPPVVLLIPPQARFSFPGEAYSGWPLIFDASQSVDVDGIIVEYSWDMGDGVTASGRTVTHTYAVPGRYAVTLTVRDNHGLTGTWVELLQVQEAPNVAPIPVLSMSRRCFVGQLVGFSAYASYDPDGHIASYRWSLGDGSNAEGVAVTHRYTSPGRYNATLVVTDDGGLSSECVVQVTVFDLPRSYSWFEAVVEDESLISIPDIEASLRVDSLEATTVLVFQYLDDPHPEYVKPPGQLGSIIDVSVGDPDLIRWPLYVELRYNRSLIPLEDERRLGLFHFDEEWIQCRETGVNLEEGFVWARLHKDELGGSPLTIGFKSSIEGVTLRGLVLSAYKVESGGEVEVSVDVLSIAGEASRYTLVLEVNGVPHSIRTVYLEPGESKLVTWTVFFQDAGDYQVKVGDLVRLVRVAGGALPDLEVSAILPAEAVAGQELTISFTVWNRGESESPLFSVSLYCDGVEGGRLLMGPLQAGAFLESIFSWVPGSSGEYVVRIVVDEEGYVTELLKENNEFRATIFVMEPGVDYYRIAITLGLLVLVLLSILVPYYMLKLRKPSKQSL